MGKSHIRFSLVLHSFVLAKMPPMKSMKAGKAGAKAMTKGALTKALATEHELKQKACSEMLDSLVDIATKEVKKTGVFTIHGLCRIIHAQNQPQKQESGM